MAPPERKKEAGEEERKGGEGGAKPGRVEASSGENNWCKSELKAD